MKELLYTQLVFVSGVFSNLYIVAGTMFLVAAFLLSRKYRLETVGLILTLLSPGVTALLKGFFRHPRPENASVTVLIPTDVYGFPSGHTVFYTVFFGYLLYLSFTLKKVNKWLRYTVRLVSIYFISLVGVSRIVLQAHFLNDVLFGYLVGGVYLFVLIKLLQFYQKRSNT